MTRLVYEIVEHDGGWAYRAAGAYSETFRSQDEARASAQQAAKEQRLSGEDAAIAFQDADGRWREELVHGDDRPQTEVEG